MRVRILMVCLGNICRSPLAQGIMNSLTSNLVDVDSAGIIAHHIGHLPDSRSIKVAAKHGVDLSNQKARLFNPHKDFKDFDHIFVMDESNYQHICQKAGSLEDVDKVMLLCDAAQQKPREVKDPYYGSDDGFEEVYQQIFSACTHIIKTLNLPCNGE